MIAPLRRAHRLATALLAVALPCTFVVGISARQQQLEETNDASKAWWKPHPRPSNEVYVQISGDRRTARLVSALQASPDLLVFWAPSNQTHISQATYLGRFYRDGTYVLPQADGYIFLFSGATREIVDRRQVPQ